jgi:hypothetical protein
VGALAPRRLERERVQRLDELVRADALPTLGWSEVEPPPDHPLRVDPGLPAGALAGTVCLLRVDARTRPDVVDLARLLRGARPRGTSRLWWIASNTENSVRNSVGAPTGRAVLSVCALGRPPVRFRVAIALPLGLPLLRAVARAGVVLVDPTTPETPPDPARPTIALAPAVAPRTALRVLEEWTA